MLGVIPQRFQALKGLDLYFGMARGIEGATALDMSKFMDTNYHFEVGVPAALRGDSNWEQQVRDPCHLPVPSVIVEAASANLSWK